LADIAQGRRISDRSNRWLDTNRYNPARTNSARRLKYVRYVWREVNHAIGAGTHDYDTERQYFYVLLEFNIAVERTNTSHTSCARRRSSPFLMPAQP
jgi:hypothetical protein